MNLCNNRSNHPFLLLQSPIDICQGRVFTLYSKARSTFHPLGTTRLTRRCLQNNPWFWIWEERLVGSGLSPRLSSLLLLGESLLSPWYPRASSKCSSLNTQMRLIHHFTFSTSSICAHAVISTALSLCCSIMRGYFLASLEGTPIGG